MRELTLIGLSEDGTHVVLAASTGEQYRMPADERLRATLRNDRARLGQLEIEMDTALRPRDIQARIRRGESPEAVAEAAGVSVDKIMTYAVPVLAEREHVAGRARAATVRRKHVPGAPVVLGDTVDATLSAAGGDADDAVWDSWRREDGRWTVVVSVGDALAGTFCFDGPGRYVVAEDEAGRTLVGDVPLDLDATDLAITSSVAPPPAPETDEEEPGVTSIRRARARRALAMEQLALDGSLPEDLDDEPSTREQQESTVDLTETAEQIRAASGDVAGAPAPTDADADERARPARRRERRRVPSWDEIMFGDQK
ncbi:MAG: septation protein SepH [Nocardioidaceae bacterium]|nr:septation protein SepH [Nocardioidaceae bacterium]